MGPSTNNSKKHAAATGITANREGSVVTQNALWLTRFKFGPRLCPHDNSDCLAIYKGYIFITFYKGGMDQRQVCLARKKLDQEELHSEWKILEFPHRHCMFRADHATSFHDRRGDSHNFISLGICEGDDSIHLLYDMHAYSPSDFGGKFHDFFNYSRSKPGAALVSDEDWQLDLFLPKCNYLNQAVADKHAKAYHHVTYPRFYQIPVATTHNDENADDPTFAPRNELVVGWRVGGTMDARMQFCTLLQSDGQWSPPWTWNHCRGVKQMGFYGTFGCYNGKMYACWSRRTPADKEKGMVQDCGLYFGYCHDPCGRTGPWYTMSGEAIDLPISDFAPFCIAEPAGMGDKMMNKGFLVTPTGAVIIYLTLNGKGLQFYRPAAGAGNNDDEKKCSHFQVVRNTPKGQLYMRGEDQILLVGLKDEQPCIWSTTLPPASNGHSAESERQQQQQQAETTTDENGKVMRQEETAASRHKKHPALEWKVLYKMGFGPGYTHGVSAMHEDSTIFFYLMQRKPQDCDARPLHVWRFDLPT